MCGIAGFLTAGYAPAEATAVIEGMIRMLRHRGPDDENCWLDAEAGIALGHRRLSILDLSAEGRQPMRSRCGRYVIVFNGEIYNFRSLRRELESLGCSFRGHSDTEVMLEGISRWGLADALPRLNGMFAFAVWDREERVLHLVRDRLGEKPLYYGWMGKVFLFGSELKALCAHPSFQREINRDALALYLRHGYIPAPHSIYRGVYKLPPGTRVAVRVEDGADPLPVPFWTARMAAQRGIAEPFTGSGEEAVDQLLALLSDAVQLRMEADVPLGAFLSGGIDSSTVVALMQAHSSRPVKTFTIGFHEAGYNEAEHAAAIARHLGTDHTEIYVTPGEAMAVIPRLPILYDEPFADSSQIPIFLVSELARRHVTVSLSGDGGDELFAGYNRHFWGRRLWHRTRWLPKTVRSAAATTLTALSSEAWDSLFGILEPVLPSRLAQRQPGEKMHKLAEVLGAGREAEMYLLLASHWKNPSALVLGGREAPTLLNGADWADLPDFTLQMMYLDAVTYLPDDILVKVDRASMGVGLESRVPLLDHRVVEFAWRMPLHMNLVDGQGKGLLRRALYRYVPRELVERPKMGFAVPIGAWLRGPLRGWAEELLDEQRLRREGFLRPEPIRKKWKEHLSGRGDWKYHLWVVIMFQLWLDQMKVELGFEKVAA